jgi:hypothetical protein
VSRNNKEFYDPKQEKSAGTPAPTHRFTKLFKDRFDKWIVVRTKYRGGKNGDQGVNHIKEIIK